MQVSYLSDAHFRIFVIWDNFPFFLDRLLRDLLIFFPPPSPPPRPPDHIHLPVSTIRKRKRVESAEGGRGCPANQEKEKGEELKSARERREGWTSISWPREPNRPNWPKILFSPPPHPPHHGLVWEMKFDAGLNLNILFCIICPPDDADIAAI